MQEATSTPETRRIEIKNRWTGAVLFQCDLPTELESGMAMRHALERAVESGANLSGANLRGANLSGASLRGADLRDANLRDANLSGASLRGASLRGASLRDANLRDANLRSADLSGADLSDANLSGADLSGADLGGANLGGANLRAFRDDIWAVLSSAPLEAHAVLDALCAGRVNGSTYSGECACLVGTIAKKRGCGVESLGTLSPDSRRLAETWFLQINEGNTPENHEPTRLAAEWVAQWIESMKLAFGSEVAA